MSANKEARRHLRFDPEKNGLAVINPTRQNEEDKIIGLLRDESYEGFAALFRKDMFSYVPGEVLKVTAGHIGPLNAEVEWVSELDEKFVKAGFKFHGFSEPEE